MGFSLQGLLVAGASRCGARSLGHVGFSSCGPRAQLPCSLWGLPRPGIEPGFSVLAGRFLITGSSGKSCSFISENAFFWISFPLNVVSETSPLNINPFHGVEEYNIQSGQILRFKDTIFFFCKSYFQLIAFPLMTIHYLLYCMFRYCVVHTIWNSINILCWKNSKMYVFQV